MIDTAMQPLALVKAACDLIRVDLPELDDELLMAVAQGQGFELDVQGLPGMGLRVERQASEAALTVSARAPNAADEPDWLAGAMLANHLLRETGRRYSLDPADGALVISESLPLEGADPEDLAGLMSELALALHTAMGGDAGEDGVGADGLAAGVGGLSTGAEFSAPSLPGFPGVRG